MAILVFIKDMPVYKHGANEPFKVDIKKGARYEVEDMDAKLLVFAYTDWMTGTIAMYVESIVDSGFAEYIKE